MEGSVECAIFTASFFKDVEISQQGFTVARDIEDPAADAALAGIVLAKIGLGKLQRELVTAGRHGNRVAEIPKPLALVQLRFGGSRDGIRACIDAATTKVAIRRPHGLVLAEVGRLPCGHPQGPHLSRNSRQDLNRIEKPATSICIDGETQDAINGRDIHSPGKHLTSRG